MFAEVAEWRVFASHIVGCAVEEITFGPWQFSHCCGLRVKTSDGRDLFLKILEPRIFESHPNRAELAEMIVRQINVFACKLDHAGVFIPPICQAQTVIWQDKVYAVEVATFIGPNLADELAKRHALDVVAIDFINQIIEKTAAVAAVKNGVGIDSHPANWASDNTNRAVYIDFWPAMIEENGEKYVCFPQPTCPDLIDCAADHYFKLAGTMRTLRFNLARLGLDWEKAFFACANAVLGKEKVDEIFDDLPERQFYRKMTANDKPAMIQIVESLDSLQLDDLREIALLLIGQDSARLDNLFQMTKGVLLMSSEKRQEKIAAFRNEIVRIIRSER